MIKVYQTKYGDTGNCMAACLASIFELDVSQIPDFFSGDGYSDHESWWKNLNLWLNSVGYGILTASISMDDLRKTKGYLIVSGITSSEGSSRWHATIWKDGVLFHDPNKNPVDVDYKNIDILYPLDISKLKTVKE